MPEGALIRWKMKLLRLLALLVAVASCDAFYQIPINGQTDGLKLNLDCGTMEIKMVNWQGHAFDFYQQCDFNAPVTFFSDSIKAIWKNSTFPLSFIGEKYGNRNTLTINGKIEVRTAFHIDERVKEGDTIIVVPTGYLYCNNKRFDLDTLMLLVKEDLNSPLKGLFGKSKDN